MTKYELACRQETPKNMDAPLTPCWWVKVGEAWSWVLLAATGMFALVDIGGFSASDGTRLTQRCRRVMWGLFFCGVSLLLGSKIVASLNGGL